MVSGIVPPDNDQLDLHSELGRGTTFSIRLPLGNAETARPEEVPVAERPLRILVVDDEPVTRDVVTRYLRRDGHFVLVATNGFDALSEFSQHPFDLVLTDHGMA